MSGRGTDLLGFSRRINISTSSAPENGRSAAPPFGTDGGVPYMTYEAGESLAGAIAMARG
ncbi:hypothetical protein OG782_36305 [Streptomyces sp. NBC_00876]|uniref:hypothetical protein n=1 Tax=Streptomyces sp. NBC_00876 TaxID=2975853 RepID=UPI003865C487|nr:hypothetical protein OG782_36305 [Streptomyces sp. NBC_00876]